MTTTSAQGFPPVSESLADEREHRRQLARTINRVNSGKFNATVDVTLRASHTTTTLTDSRIYATSFIDFMPQTSSAATAKASLYVTNRIKGSCTLNHPSNAAVDQSGTVLIIG